MKKFNFTIRIAVIFLLLFITKIVNAQYWNTDGYNIWNNNDGDVMITNILSWGWGNSALQTDQGGSIELGLNNSRNDYKPYIDFHFGNVPNVQDFNTRLINSENNSLGLWFSDGAKMKFNSKDYTNNTLEFNSGSGVLGVEFWSWEGDKISQKNKNRFHLKDNLPTTYSIIDFYVDYTNPDYDQLAIKSDNTVSWGSDWSWLSADGWNGFQGPGINLNKAGLNTNATPFIDFCYGNSYPSLNHIDVKIKNSASNQLDFWTNMDYYGNGGTKVMTINNNGVYAKKITVQSSWSDFVFKPEYKLISLYEVEKYIKENGHLEGMPTEQEVKENGVELGDMTSKLLQKIEELTLYVIDQNREIEKLKDDNKKLKEVINKINSK
jgi:hypothetical protein